ncbi:hypothetical protein, partial [Streptomyces sp. WAC07061]|uniref:hypothetical protein n=1 Tax=Streptomyces sp. WAC07061 TaxID=2487410 RepID=UPI00163C6B03
TTSGPTEARPRATARVAAITSALVASRFSRPLVPARSSSATPTDQWGDVYDTAVPGAPVIVEWFTADPESLTITRITWLETTG